jgi:hypothetical protein
VTGTLQLGLQSSAGAPAAEAAQTVTFSVAASGAYDIRFPGNTAFATDDGAQVQILDDRRIVQVRSGLPSQVAGRPAWVQGNGELELPNDAVSRVLYPDKWVEVMAPKNEMAITYVGLEKAVAGDARHYRITFGAGTVKYSAEGWDFWIDARTGVLVRYLIHFSESVGGGVEEAVVGDLDTRAVAVPVTSAAVPAGYDVEAAVQTGTQVAMVKTRTEPGDTVAAVVARAQQSAGAASGEK